MTDHLVFDNATDWYRCNQCGRVGQRGFVIYAPAVAICASRKACERRLADSYWCKRP